MFAVLPTRNAVLLPGAVAELAVGRARSVAALRHAATQGEPVLVLLQRTPAVDEPEPPALNTVGTLATVLEASRAAPGVAHVGVRGLQRVRVTAWEQRGDLLLAAVDLLPWAPPEPALSEPLACTLGALLEHGLRHQLSPITFGALEARAAVEQLAALSQVAPLSPEALQRALEEESLTAVAGALESLRDERWLARLLRWLRARAR